MKNRTYKAASAGAVLALLLAGCGGSAASGSDAPTPSEAATPSATTATTAASPRAALRGEVTDVNDKAKVAFSKGEVDVKFPMSDNLTTKLMRSGAQQDTVKMLKAVHESPVKADVVSVTITGELQDDEGNSSTERVVSAIYSHKELERINYDNIDPGKIWEVADLESFVHAALRNA